MSKRRKLSDSLGSRTALSSHNGRSQHSPSSISEDLENDGADGSESISVDDNLASTARTTPDVFESASLTKPQLCPEVTDDSTRIGRSAKSSARSMLMVCCTTWWSGVRLWNLCTHWSTRRSWWMSSRRDSLQCAWTKKGERSQV